MTIEIYRIYPENFELTFIVRMELQSNSTIARYRFLTTTTIIHSVFLSLFKFIKEIALIRMIKRKRWMILEVLVTGRYHIMQIAYCNTILMVYSSIMDFCARPKNFAIYIFIFFRSPKGEMNILSEQNATWIQRMLLFFDVMGNPFKAVSVDSSFYCTSPAI